VVTVLVTALGALLLFLLGPTSAVAALRCVGVLLSHKPRAVDLSVTSDDTLFSLNTLTPLLLTL